MHRREGDSITLGFDLVSANRKEISQRIPIESIGMQWNNYGVHPVNRPEYPFSICSLPRLTYILLSLPCTLNLILLK